MGAVDPKNRGAVLVVDDDEGLRSEVRDVLEGEGYIVLEADNGSAALSILRGLAAIANLKKRSNYDLRLVILDLLMPRMTGWEVVEVLRRDPQLSHIPVLVTSGLPVHGDASGIGATMYWLRKPFGEEELLAAMDEVLGHALAS